MDRVAAGSERCPQCTGKPSYRWPKVSAPQRPRCDRCGRAFKSGDVRATAEPGARLINGATAAPVAVDFLEWAHSVAASQHGSSMRKRLEGLFGGRPNGKRPH